MENYENVAIFPSLPRTRRGFPVSLAASSDGKRLVYCAGNGVYILPIENPSEQEVIIHLLHSAPTSCAKLSPCDKFCASGDEHGILKVWSCSTKIMKHSLTVSSGPIRDIAWSFDGKQVAAVGEGRNHFGQVFMFNTGTSNGSLIGQCRSIISIDFNPASSNLIITGSEDHTIGVYTGFPFKFRTTLREHSGFVNVVRFRPTGEQFVTGSADGKLILFNYNTMKKSGEFGNPAHHGSIFGASWSSEGSRIVTSSGDRTIKVWSVETFENLSTTTFGTQISDQQLGVVWTQFAIISVSLSGTINRINVNKNIMNRCRTFNGHNKSITALALSQDSSFLYSTDFQGNITKRNLKKIDESQSFLEGVHQTRISQIAEMNNHRIVTIGWDDKIRLITCDEAEKNQIDVLKLPSQPLDFRIVSDSLLIVICFNHLVVIENNAILSQTNVTSTPTSLTITHQSIDTFVAIGDEQGNVNLLSLDSNHSLKFLSSYQNSAAITSMAFSPDDRCLVMADAERKVVIFDVNDEKVLKLKKENLKLHTAKVNCICWSPDGRRLASGGADANLIVWNLDEMDPILIKRAHSSPINCVLWIDNQSIVSGGQDANIKIWNI